MLHAADPARLQNWGLVAFLPRREYEGPHLRSNSVYAWVLDFIRRCGDLGMDMGYQPGDVPEVCGCAAMYRREAFVENVPCWPYLVILCHFTGCTWHQPVCITVSIHSGAQAGKWSC